MTAQSTCHTPKEILGSLPVDLKRAFEKEHQPIVKVSKTNTNKTSKPRYSEATISWEYFQNELEFE
jgi:hypothetical protein